MFIDTHAHLYVEDFDQDRNQVIARALNQGVYHFVMPAIDSQYTQAMHALQTQYPKQISLMMGLHPTHVKENFTLELDHVSEQLANNTYVAVGEIGIDLYWDTSTLAAQQAAFAIQIEWALEKKLPIVIHCRNAFEEVFQVLEHYACDELKGIFHCFTGTLNEAHRAIRLNMKLGIGGVLTFKNGKIDQFLAQIPLEHIVLETDAPYLAPVPYRGKRNESSYLTIIAAKLAEIHHLELDKIAHMTTNNAKELFKIK